MIDDQNRIILKWKTKTSELESQLSKTQLNLKEQTKLIESKDEMISAKSEELRGDFECDNCNFCTNDRTILVKHKANEHKPTFSCDKCNFKSGKRSDWQLHIVLQHP